MAEIGVLGGVEADADGGGVPLADAQHQIADGRIEGAGIGVGDLGVEGHAVSHGERRRAAAKGRARHDHHGRHPALEAWRGVAQHQLRRRGADAEQALSRPDEQGAADAVAAGGQEHHPAGAAIAGLIQRRLDGGGVVGAPVAHGLDHNRPRIVRLDGEDRTCRQGRRGQGAGQAHDARKQPALARSRALPGKAHPECFRKRFHPTAPYLRPPSGRSPRDGEREAGRERPASTAGRIDCYPARRGDQKL